MSAESPSLKNPCLLVGFLQSTSSAHLLLEGPAGDEDPEMGLGVGGEEGSKVSGAERGPDGMETAG